MKELDDHARYFPQPVEKREICLDQPEVKRFKDRYLGYNGGRVVSVSGHEVINVPGFPGFADGTFPADDAQKVRQFWDRTEVKPV